MFKIQHKIGGVFVDIESVDSIDYSNLHEVREYLKSIRQDEIIYRIFSVRYEKLPQKPKKEKTIQEEIYVVEVKSKKVKVKNKGNKIKFRVPP